MGSPFPSGRMVLVGTIGRRDQGPVSRSALNRARTPRPASRRPRPRCARTSRHPRRRKSTGGAAPWVAAPVGAGNRVTAVELVFSPGPGLGKFGIWLRGSRALRHLDYSCHCESPTWRCFGCSAGSPCSPGPRSRQGRRDPDPAAPGRRAPAAGQGPEAVGRPGGAGCSGSAAPVGAENLCHLGRCCGERGPVSSAGRAGLGPSGRGMIFGLWA